MGQILRSDWNVLGSYKTHYWGFIKFAFHNGVSEVFSESVKEILQNNYLKTNFENPGISDFVVTFEISKGVNFLKNYYGFWTLKAYVLETGNNRKVNESILKSGHQGFSFDGTVKF